MSDYYRHERKKRAYQVIEITPAKILMIVVGVMVGFVIPVQLINMYEQDSRLAAYTHPQVAGASDVNYGELISQKFNELLINRTALLSIGLVMLIVAIVLSIYVIYRLRQPGRHKDHIDTSLI